MFVIVVYSPSTHGEIEGKVEHWSRSRTLATFRSDLRHWFWRYTCVDAWQVTHGRVGHLIYRAIEHTTMPRVVYEDLSFCFRATPDMDENMDYTYARGTFTCIRRSYQVIDVRLLRPKN